MKYKVISCNVFKREIEYAAARSPHTLEIEFLELGEHARPRELRRKLQERIDAIDGFDAVLLGYGLCGTATDGLAAGKVPLVLPRSHDCCGILLGSRKRFEELVRRHAQVRRSVRSVLWSMATTIFPTAKCCSATAMPRWSNSTARTTPAISGTRCTRSSTGGFNRSLSSRFRKFPVRKRWRAAGPEPDEEGRAFQVETGSLRLIRGLLAGNWDESEFLIVPPGRSIRQVGDWNEIIRLA